MIHRSFCMALQRQASLDINSSFTWHGTSPIFPPLPRMCFVVHVRDNAKVLLFVKVLNVRCHVNRDLDFIPTA